jgi:hypothetical protein
LLELRLIILDGGPFVSPLLWPMPSGDGTAPVEVPYGSCFEHFERTEEFAEVAGHRIPVYRWYGRTPLTVEPLHPSLERTPMPPSMGRTAP